MRAENFDSIKFNTIFALIMELHVTIDWCEKNYSASLATEGLGAVITTAKTETDVIKKFQETFDFHIEGMKEDGDTIPAYITNGDYKFVYERTMSATLRNLQQYTTLSAISRVTGIKHAQLSHYANGTSRPRAEQKNRILQGLHTIGQECLSAQ